MLANIKSPEATLEGLLTVMLVVVTCVDAAVCELWYVIEANASALAYNRNDAPTAATIPTFMGPLKTDTNRFFIKIKNYDPTD